MLDWVKRNRLTSLVIIILLILVIKDYLLGIRPLSSGIGGLRNTADFETMVAPKGLSLPAPFPPTDQYAPTDNQNRLVVQESSLSMVVLNVRETSDKIIDKAKSAGGYMVSTSLTNPEEAPFANVVIRMPADQLRPILDYLRGLSVKVTSENILGTDVTDEYVDIQARLTILEKTKTEFEEIMTKATEIQDILTVQRELINIQDQIDNLKGRQQYLEQTAKLAKLTTYLSTDEFSLPYAPSEKFRPEVIVKQAFRSLYSNVRDFLGLLIWAGVYGLIWGPVALVIYLLWRKYRKTSVIARSER